MVHSAPCSRLALAETSTFDRPGFAASRCRPRDIAQLASPMYLGPCTFAHVRASRLLQTGMTAPKE